MEPAKVTPLDSSFRDYLQQRVAGFEQSPPSLFIHENEDHLGAFKITESELLTLKNLPNGLWVFGAL